MVNTFRLRAKRTTGSTPPADLLFGELAYSDANQQLYVGRPNGPPATIGANPTDYGPAIADLEQGLTEAGESLSLAQLNQLTQSGAIETLTTDVATLNTSQGTQDTAIASHAGAITGLYTSQGTQDTAIAANAAAVATLNTSQGTQDTAIAALSTEIATLDTATGEQATALAALEISQAGQDSAIASHAGAITGLYTSQGTQDTAIAANAAAVATLATVASTGAYADLSGKPALFSGAYADLSGKPALFSGAYADLSGKPTIPIAALTYDQSTEPSSPAVGQWWRDGNGRILQWSGSLWLAGEREIASTIVATISSTVSSVGTAVPRRCVVTRGEIRAAVVSTVNASNFWTAQLGATLGTAFGTADSLTLGAPQTINTSGSLVFSVAITQTLTVGRSFYVDLTKNNSPGGLQFEYSLWVRDIR